MHHSHIDRFAHGDSPVHRLDARAKLVGVLAYTAVLISFPRYALAAMAPMAVLPLAMLLLAGIPVTFALRRVAILSPLIVMLCLAAAVYDRAPAEVAFGPWRGVVRGGALTAGNVAVKFALGLTALTGLMSSTPFARLLEAMRRLGAPNLLVMQLGLLYRYLFVLIDEAMRIRRGRDFRGAARAPVGRRLAAAGGVLGSLLVRTLDRSDRIHTAMAARGFVGEPHGLARLRFRWTDAAVLAGVAAYLIFCRWGYPAMM